MSQSPTDPAPPMPVVTAPAVSLAPRGLVVLWCLWLMGSWLLALWTQSPAPAVRWMVIGSLLGMTLFWPAIRLSQDPQPRRQYLLPNPATILFDWLTLNLVMQVVVWPLRLYANWRISQTLWLSAAIAAWSLLTGLVIAWGIDRAADAGRRLIAMALCLLLLVGEPMVLGAIDVLVPPAPGSSPWLLRVSPLQAVWELSSLPPVWPTGHWSGVILSVAAAALLGWIALAIARAARPADPRVGDAR